MNRFFKRLAFDFWYLRKPPWDTGITPPELQAFLTTHPPGRHWTWVEAPAPTR